MKNWLKKLILKKSADENKCMKKFPGMQRVKTNESDHEIPQSLTNIVLPRVYTLMQDFS